MLDEDHRNAELPADVEDEPGHVLGLLQVHARNRLVEEEQLWLHRKGSAELDSLLDAIRKHANRELTPRLDLEEFDDVLDPCADLHLLSLCRAEPDGTDNHPSWSVTYWPVEMFSRTVMWAKSSMFWNVRAMPSCAILSGRLPDDRLALPPDVALLGLVDAVQAVERRVFPAPFGPMIAKSSPSSTWKVLSDSAWTAPNASDTCSNSSRCS